MGFAAIYLSIIILALSMCALSTCIGSPINTFISLIIIRHKLVQTILSVLPKGSEDPLFIHSQKLSVVNSERKCAPRLLNAGFAEKVKVSKPPTLPHSSDERNIAKSRKPP